MRCVLCSPEKKNKSLNYTKLCALYSFGTFFFFERQIYGILNNSSEKMQRYKLDLFYCKFHFQSAVILLSLFNVSALNQLTKW